MHFRPAVALLLAFCLLRPATAFSARNDIAPSGPPAPPEAIAGRFAEALLAAARREGARRVRVDLRAARGLEGAPALVAIGTALDDVLYGEADRALLEPTAGAPPELEIVAELARVRGRVVLGGALRRGGKDATVANWVLVSMEEDSSWWPWLAPADVGPVADPTGFAWAQVGVMEGIVRDADAGDLDGDGLFEVVIATDEALHVFAVMAGAPRVVATHALEQPGAGSGAGSLTGTGTGTSSSSSTVTGADAAAAAAAVSRAPRTFVRIAPGAGAPGEVLVRRPEETRSRVFGWEAATSRLVARGEREGVVLSSLYRAGGAVDSIAGELQAGTNRFDVPPRVKRGPNWKIAQGVGAWLDLRAADLGGVAMLAEGAAVYGLLDVHGTLRLLSADLRDAGKADDCGSAYALADWDGDGRADPLCSGDGPADAGSDRLAIEKLWSTEVAGTVTAIAAGPVENGTAALVFVQRPGAEASEVWLLERRAR